MKDLIFPHEVEKHKDRNETWNLDNLQIEDRIKELRKEIYKLQNCRKNQPELIIFRKPLMKEGKLEVHIFHGWNIIDLKKGLFCADWWTKITPKEAEYIKKKYKLTKEAIKEIDDTLLRGKER